MIAYTAVSYWTLSIQLALLEPAALFAICHSMEPAPLDDNNGYKWEVQNGEFSAVLIGKVQDDSVRWSMTVSGGDLSDFTWFTGTSTITGNAGSWTFYDTAAVAGAYPARRRLHGTPGAPPTDDHRVGVLALINHRGGDIMGYARDLLGAQV